MTINEGTKFGRYEVRSLIGAGGMGEVYLANDTELDRSVAIKILPADLASDKTRVQRFVQEAKAASGLNHPNILTIYEIGVTDDSRFIAAEFIDGETLRQRMNHGMKLFDALDIAIQVTSALAAAHAAGIVHRDIKPENVMIRRDGYAKVLDFGLAKLTEIKNVSTDTEAATRAMVNTGAGTVMGTASYMSPEQAKGVPVDARTDLWSLGVLLYEMTTGHLPFHGDTPTETISLILLKEPPPITRYTDEAPEELVRIVEKSITKDADERYQTAKDLLIDLRHLKRKLEIDAEIDRTLPPEVRAAVATRSHSGGSTVSGGSHTNADTLKSRGSSAEYVVDGIKRHWMGAAAAAVIVLIVGAASLFYFVRSTPALTAKDTILLTDFVNTTGENVFDGTLKQALAVQLGQSPYLNIFANDRVGEALKFMGKKPDERITRDIAREICQRQGIKAMIVGSIAGLGSHYVITLEAINAKDGESLALEQAEAPSKEQVLTMLGTVASKMRERLGESLASIKKFDAPIEQATTSSLEALKAFSDGNDLRDQGHQPESVPFYKRAIELDPNFALAYARLATIFNNGSKSELAREYATHAYELRDRVSERERYYISEKYSAYVTGDLEEAVKGLIAWAQNYPNDYIPHNNLSVDYMLLGRPEEALKEALEALRISPDTANVQDNLVDSYKKLGRYDEAFAVLEQYLGQNKDRIIYRAHSMDLAVIRSDTESIKRDLEWAAARKDDPDGYDMQSSYAVYSGQLNSGRAFAKRSTELHIAAGETQNAAQSMTLMADSEALAGQCTQAKADVSQGLSYSRGKFELVNAAVALAYCGDLQAQVLIDEMQKRFAKDTGSSPILVPIIKGVIDLNKDNPSQAIEDMQPAMRFEFGTIAGLWLNYFRGQSYLKAKMPAESAAEFTKILDHAGLESISPVHVLAHLGLARAATMNGDMATARKEYQDLFAAWKDADGDIPILIEAKKEYEQVK